jgi:hypothetical protein
MIRSYLRSAKRQKLTLISLALLATAGMVLSRAAAQIWSQSVSVPDAPPIEDILEDKPLDMTPDGPPSDYEFLFTRLAHYSPGFQLSKDGQAWPTDYPKADRQFLQGLLRYTVIQGRKQENVVRPAVDELFNFPFVYAVEVGYMQLSDEEAKRLRQYLLRGGFMIVDDFHGTREWANFETQMKKVFPERQIEDVEVSEPIFHCFFDIEKLFELPGLQYLYSHRIFEKDGTAPRYAAIYDDNHRIMVMINHNVDIGDAWEWADLPQYPSRYTTQAYRLGVNYIVYALSH